MEGIAANAGHTLGDHHAGQAAATVEGIVANTSHAIRNRHAGQTAATVEGMAANTSHAIWNRHTGQAAATVEGIAVNAGHAIWNRHAGQAAAAVEGRAADACHALRNLHRCQLGTVLKGGLTDRFNATGQAYGSQLQARVKGIVTNAFYARLHHCRQNLGSVGIPRGHRGVGIILHLPAAGNGQCSVLGEYPCQVIAASAMGNAGQHGQSFIFNGRLGLSVGILEDLAAAGTGIVGVVANVPVGRLHRLGFGHIVAKRGQAFGFCRGCRLAVCVLKGLIAHRAGVVGIVAACCAGGFYPLGFGHGVSKGRQAFGF